MSNNRFSYGLFSVFIYSAIILLSTSCGDLSNLFPKITFNAPFPKRNIDLSEVLGDKLVLKNGFETRTFNISKVAESNFIIDPEFQDTIFFGKVSKFRGMYFLNYQLDDSSYFIYAIKIRGNLVYGFNSAYKQTMLLQRSIERGENSKMIMYQDENVIRVHPSKRDMKKAFASILDSLSPDTIWLGEKIIPRLPDTTTTITKIDSEEFNFISKVYPNPATDFINIELHASENVFYQLINLKGQIVLNGQIINTNTRLDISTLKDGVYAVSIINQKNNESETVKILKTK